MRKIAAVDPGKTTGYFSTALDVSKASQLDNLLGLRDVLDLDQPEIVIVEVFRLYPWQAKNLSWNEMPAAQAIGVVKLWCAECNAEYIEQPASVRKGISKEWLQKVGFWGPTRGLPHARDAARHLLYYCISNHIGEVVQKLLDKEDLH